MTKTSNLSFKGYFAAPLKTLYVHPSKAYGGSNEIFSELQQIGAVEGFNVLGITNNGVIDDFSKISRQNISLMAQDCRAFLKDNVVLLFRDHCFDNKYMKQLSNNLNKMIKVSKSHLDGGNLFIGKKQNGESILLMGDGGVGGIKANYSDKVLNDAAEDFNIEKQNVHRIIQPNFHIDMALRPLDYPDVLVGDSNLFLDLLKKYDDGSSSYNRVIYSIKTKLNALADGGYPPVLDEVDEGLIKAGLNPIHVPSFIDHKNPNFMNAIVHKDKNGNFVYITNKAPKSGIIDYNKIFEEYMMENVPRVKSVHFVSGIEYNNGQNYLTSNILRKKSAGVHCIVGEEPYFDDLSQMVNNPFQRH